MDKIKTILFDIDGTLLDSGEFILQATEHALSSFGYFVPGRSLMAKNVGKPFPDYYFALTGSSKDTEKLVDAHRAFQLNNFHLAKLFPNSLETLNQLKRKGYKLAVVTTRSKKTSRQSLKEVGILDLFDVIISAEDSEELKPHPAPLLKALEYLKKAPEQAVMVGDSYFDIQAGKNAGTKTIRATYGFHTDNLHEPEPDFFISDIKDLLKLL